MKLFEACTEENFAWETPIGKVYQYINQDNEPRTVFQYQIPFAPDQESVFLSKYHIPANERMQVYQNLVRCIQRQVSVSKTLASYSIPSILTYSKVEQNRSEDNVVSIYLETEQVRPLTSSLLSEKCSYVTLVDILTRLAIILRDIERSPATVILRGFDLNEVYINASNRILLGGFFYSQCSSLGPYPAFLPCRPPHISSQVLAGSPGSHKSDIKALAYSFWNLFSGIPHEAEWNSGRLPQPEYADEELVNILLSAIAGEDEVCNAFRRKLADHRKQIIKDGTADRMIPIRQVLRKQPEIVWVPTVAIEVENNTTNI